jgi:antirestriction protein ArdC
VQAETGYRISQNFYREKKHMDTYQIVTDRMIAALEAGTVPWRMPWHKLSAIRNMRGTRYHGVNTLMLACAGAGKGYSCNTWATFNQIRAGKGMVNAGEHGTPVVFWHFFTTGKPGEVVPEDEKATGKLIPMLRHYTVFNLEQQTGIEIPTIPEVNHDPIVEAEAIIDHYADKPEIRFAPGRAVYLFDKDVISVPPKEHYQNVAEYYSTLFHEATHSTGVEKRLNRKDFAKGGFGSESYSKEELIAEMGAAFLAAETGIVNQTIDNSAAYIASWLGKLKNDKKLVVTAAGAAQKATDYILGRKAE